MATQTNTCALTISGADRTVEALVSTDTPIRELVPEFVELCLDMPPTAEEVRRGWAIMVDGERILPEDSTLAESGVHDGAVLSLTERAPSPPTLRALPAPEAGDTTPRERTLEALPSRLGRGSRFWRSTKAFLDSPDPEPPDPKAEAPAPSSRELLTRPDAPSARQRARFRWRETDYLGRLDRQIVAPRLTRCATIAVVSPKGGVGKTTLTALLGSLLASTRRDRIVAVDTNPDYGSLGRQLTPDHDVFVDDLVDILDRPDLSVTGLDQHLGRAFDGLMVLPAPTDPVRMARLDEDAYARVILRLQSLVGILVLDCGTGLQEPAARAAQAAADQIILVSDAQPATASLVADAAGLLRTVGAPLTLVVNKMPTRERETRIDLEGLQDLVPYAHGLITIEEDSPAATRVAAGDFAWRDAPASWQRSLRELVVTLQADWPELGLSS
jgi:MinD-like ATPase involved in chromosome partitioning or flagellar assembly